MKKNIVLKVLLIGVVSSVGALADMSVDKSGGSLTVTSTLNGKVHAKVIGPNNEVVLDETYEGNSFSWSPSGEDGVYRYDVRVEGDYAGGLVEVKNTQIISSDTGEESL